MADPRSAPLSFRPPARITRDEEFDERLFDQVAGPPAADQADEDLDPDDEPPPVREGLPAGFRMRADAHYVEQVVGRRLADPILLIPVGEIDPPPAGQDPDGDLEPLVRSVARFGILQPLLVRRHAGRYALVAGVRRLAAATAAGLSEVPCMVHTADAAKATDLAEATNLQALPTDTRPANDWLPDAAFAELTEQLGAIEACLHLFGERERPTRERVGMTLIRTEVRRAAWLTQALAVLSGRARAQCRPLDAASLVRRLVAALALDRSVTGVDVEARGAETAAVRGDEQLLTVAVAGLVEAVRAAAERCAGARVLSTVKRDGERVLVEVALAGAELPSALRGAFLDLESADRPGGARSAIGVKAAARVATLHSGSLTATDAGSPRLVLSLPAPHA